jgi:hypothetical protein
MMFKLIHVAFFFLLFEVGAIDFLRKFFVIIQPEKWKLTYQKVF